MSRRKHFTQAGRASQMRTVIEKIIELGGWIKVKKEIGEASFMFYIASELGCTKNKAREYIQMAVEGALATAKVDGYLESKGRKA